MSKSYKIKKGLMKLSPALVKPANETLAYSALTVKLATIKQWTEYC